MVWLGKLTILNIYILIVVVVETVDMWKSIIKAYGTPYIWGLSEYFGEIWRYDP